MSDFDEIWRSYSLKCVNCEKLKKFEKNYSSDKFLSRMVHCASALPEVLIFISLLQNIRMLGISKKSGSLEGMFILLGKFSTKWMLQVQD